MADTQGFVVRKLSIDDIPKVLKLRYEVLDKPLGILEKRNPSPTDLEETTIHIGGFMGQVLITAVRLDQIDLQTFLVRRMATSPEFQKKGYARAVLGFAEEVARTRGANRVVLHSRPDAVAFYEKLDYIVSGRYEMHDGLNEPEMQKYI